MYKQMIPADVVAGEAQSGGPADKVNEFVPSHEVAAAQMRYDKNATCDRCGNFGAFDLGGSSCVLCATKKLVPVALNLAQMICGGIATRIDPQGSLRRE